MFFRDIFAHYYIVLHEDGAVVSDGAIAPDGRPFTGKASHPARVRWFKSFVEAREFRDKNVVNGSVHLVDHLTILQEKFSY